MAASCGTLRPVAMSSAEILIASAVACRPAEDLAAGLSAIGRPARMVSALDAASWRERFSSGSLGRSVARAAGMLYPLRLAARLVRTRPSTVVATTNPFFLPPLLVLLRRLHGWRVVPLIYDLYPDALVAAGLVHRRSVAARVGTRLNRYTFRHASAVVFIGEAMAAGARENYGAPVISRVIATGAALRDFERARGGSAPQTKPFLTSYVGNMGAMHDVETLAGAIPRLLATSGLPELEIVIAASGGGAEGLKDRCRELDDVRLRFCAPLGDSEWFSTLLSSHISVVTLSRAAARTSVPSKAFSALAAGSAILAVAPQESDLSRLVVEHGVGAVVEPGDVEGLTSAWLRLLRDRERLEQHRANARRAAERFDTEVLAREWVALLEEVGSSGLEGCRP